MAQQQELAGLRLALAPQIITVTHTFPVSASLVAAQQNLVLPTPVDPLRSYCRVNAGAGARNNPPTGSGAKATLNAAGDTLVVDLIGKSNDTVGLAVEFQVEVFELAARPQRIQVITGSGTVVLANPVNPLRTLLSRASFTSEGNGDCIDTYLSPDGQTLIQEQGASYYPCAYLVEF